MSADRDPPAGPIAEQFSRGRTVAEIEEVLGYTRDEIRDVLCTEERLRHLYHEKGLSQREIGE
ncbi:MAG: hypothetical protein SVU88_04125, partial [Candidatus Nanohaloarchaea archaeon]|nr:hypothetical protein [Candidatus Nanohaloarchaea archaeon]